ncbi:MAG: hypothetical protein ACJAV6_000621 [Candidatus Paceibacteria bacterium]|jgi:hypothetical protein
MKKEQIDYYNNGQYKEIDLLLKAYNTFLFNTINGVTFTEGENENRLIQEYLNKIYSLIISVQNQVDNKDSLSLSLYTKYIYELLVDFLYIFSEKEKVDEKIELFFKFGKETHEIKWHKSQIRQKSEKIKHTDFDNLHGIFYKTINKFTHPSIFSLLVNRRGTNKEIEHISLCTNTICRFLIIILEHERVNKYFEINKIDLENLKLKIR